MILRYLRIASRRFQLLMLAITTLTPAGSRGRNTRQKWVSVRMVLFSCRSSALIPDTGVAFFPSDPAKAMVDDGTNTDTGGTARSLLKGGVLSRLKTQGREVQVQLCSTGFLSDFPTTTHRCVPD